MADFAADLTESDRPSRSAMTRGVISSSNTLPRESVTKLAAGTTQVTMGRVDKEETLVVPVALIGGDSS